MIKVIDKLNKKEHIVGTSAHDTLYIFEELKKIYESDKKKELDNQRKRDALIEKTFNDLWD